MQKEGQAVIAWMLANNGRIGVGVWELLTLIDHEQQIAVGRIAAKLGKDRRTVTRNLRHLEDAGIIERKPVPGRASYYLVRLEK
jgi:DNA-binding MarR family transcriptional regulator